MFKIFFERFQDCFVLSPHLPSTLGGRILVPFTDKKTEADSKIYTFSLSHTTQTLDPIFQLFTLKDSSLTNHRTNIFSLSILKHVGLAIKETASVKMSPKATRASDQQDHISVITQKRAHSSPEHVTWAFL